MSSSSYSDVKYQKLSYEENGQWTPSGQIHDGTHYILSGPSDGELVVCVHGIDGYYYSFNHLAKRLAQEGYQVLQYDLIGRGFSLPHKTKLYGEREHIDQLHQLLIHLKFIHKPYHLLGLSMGGSLVTLYASYYIEEIKSLILLAPAGLMKLPNVETLRNYPCLQYIIRYPIQYSSLYRPWSKTFYKHDGIFKDREDYFFYHKYKAIKHNPTQLDASWACIMQFPLYGIENHVEKIAYQSSLPVHLIFGDKDVIVPYSYNYNRWKSILDKGQCTPTYTIVPDAGHNILLEFPDESSQLILNYLKSL